jgi:hypothetical protein
VKYVPLAIITTIVVFMATVVACAPAAPTANTATMKQLSSGIYYIDPEPGVRCYARYSDTLSCVKQ